MSISEGGICFPIQEAAIRLFGQNGDTLQMRSNTGFVDALRSPQNTQSSQINVTQLFAERRAGKIDAQVRVEYEIRAVEADVDDTRPTDFCAEGRILPKVAQTLTVQQYVSHVMEAPLEITRTDCSEEAFSRVAKTILSGINALNQKVNKRAITVAAGLVGNYYDGDPTKTYPILANGGNSVNAAGFADMEIDLGRWDAVGSPIIVGAGALEKYTRLQQIGCCNDFGIDNSLAAVDYFRDTHIDGIIAPYTGNSSFLAFLPGTVQFVETFMNVGTYAWNFGALGMPSEAQIFTDPRTLMQYDIDIVASACGKKHTITLSKVFDVFALPTSGIYQATDPLDGANFFVQGEFSTLA